MNIFYSESLHYRNVFQKHMNVNIPQYNHTYIFTISICHMKMWKCMIHLLCPLNFRVVDLNSKLDTGKTHIL